MPVVCISQECSACLLCATMCIVYTIIILPTIYNTEHHRVLSTVDNITCRQYFTLPTALPVVYNTGYICSNYCLLQASRCTTVPLLVVGNEAFIYLH